MGKQANPRTLSDSEARSVARNLRVSPQKLNLVAQMIRKETASKAISILQFSKRRISYVVEKALTSAIENAAPVDVAFDDIVVAKDSPVGMNALLSGPDIMSIFAAKFSPSENVV